MKPTRRRNLRATRVRVPDHVAYRSFPGETVLLNLETGQYHGVNPTGGRMLEVLEKTSTVEAAAASLRAEYGLPADKVEADLLEFCTSLEERGLIVLSSA